MPRHGRRPVNDAIYHVLNRGNCRMDLFDKPDNFAAFVRPPEQSRRRTGMRVLACCLMHNHCHLVPPPSATTSGSRPPPPGWDC